MLDPDLTKKLKILSLAEAETILRLRVIVARAAQIDSLRWWDDRSLTPEGDFVTARLFPFRPRLAGAKIAVATARARHWEVVPRLPGVVHLFDLGDEIEYELAAVPLDESWIPAPLTTPKSFFAALAEAVPDGTGCSYEGRADPASDADAGAGAGASALKIGLSLDTDPALKPALAEAGALALAYNDAAMSRPLFPYLQR